MPRVSVISAAYNMEHERDLVRSFKSITEQSLHDIEFIICDDGSTVDLELTRCRETGRTSGGTPWQRW